MGLQRLCQKQLDQYKVLPPVVARGSALQGYCHNKSTGAEGRQREALSNIPGGAELTPKDAWLPLSINMLKEEDAPIMNLSINESL